MTWGRGAAAASCREGRAQGGAEAWVGQEGWVGA